MRHLQFHLKIRQNSQPSQENSRASYLSIRYCESVKAIDFHICKMRGRSMNLGDAFGNGKQGRLVWIAQHRHNHAIE